MDSSEGTAALAQRLLRTVEGAGGRIEIVRALARAALARAAGSRGALHVRRPVVLADHGLRWCVPPFDNSFVSAAPGEANGPVVRELLRRLESSDRPVCVDVGANMGFVGLTVAKRFPARTVLMLEPIPWLADAIRRSAALNGLGNVRVVNRAIAPVPHVDLRVPRLRGVWLTTLSSAAGRMSHEADRVPLEAVRVEAVTLDAVLAAEGFAPHDVGAIKIDVEGLEPEVLATGRGVLAAHPAILFEAWDSAAREKIEAVLRPAGYGRIESLDETNFVATA